MRYASIAIQNRKSSSTMSPVVEGVALTITGLWRGLRHPQAAVPSGADPDEDTGLAWIQLLLAVALMLYFAALFSGMTHEQMFSLFH
jgi:hypothetical protein